MSFRAKLWRTYYWLFTDKLDNFNSLREALEAPYKDEEVRR